jgi:hypothetical protein
LLATLIVEVGESFIVFWIYSGLVYIGLVVSQIYVWTLLKHLPENMKKITKKVSVLIVFTKTVEYP